MNIVTIGKRLVPVEQIAFVEPFDPSANPEFKPEKEFKARVVLLNRNRAFSRGAATGYLPSVYRLAKMYQEGRGTVQDIERSHELLRAAMIRGHLFAKRDLGILYLHGSFGLVRVLAGVGQLVSLGLDMIRITITLGWRDEAYEDRILA